MLTRSIAVRVPALTIVVRLTGLDILDESVSYRHLTGYGSVERRIASSHNGVDAHNRRMLMIKGSYAKSEAASLTA